VAAEDRHATDHLSFLRLAAAEIRRYGFFALVRRAEARAPQLPRVGRSRLPSQNVVDMAHAPTMDFPGPTLEGIETHKTGRATIRGFFLGLTGPMGALPLHLTEFAYYERKYAKTQPFGRFLDLLTGRMLQFFYRAWADTQPAACADRPDDNPFSGYVAALTGAYQGAEKAIAFPAEARLHYAGLFASRRSAAGIQDALSNLLRTPVRLREYAVRQRMIEPDDRTRLGGAFCQLGADTVAGSSVRTVTDAFRVVLKARNLREYEEFLPTGRRFAIAAEALEAFAPSHLEWDLELEIDEAETRGMRLDGRARLGWTSWSDPNLTSGKVRADARLRRASGRRKPKTDVMLEIAV